MDYTSKLNLFGEEVQAKHAIRQIQEAGESCIESIELKIVDDFLMHFNDHTTHTLWTKGFGQLFSSLLENMSTIRSVYGAVTAVKLKLGTLDHLDSMMLEAIKSEMIEPPAKRRVDAINKLSSIGPTQSTLETVQDSKRSSPTLTSLLDEEDDDLLQHAVAVEKTKDNGFKQSDSKGEGEPQQSSSSVTLGNGKGGLNQSHTFASPKKNVERVPLGEQEISPLTCTS